MFKKWLPILLILLIALALRTWLLTDIPPGLTHDEANHGREALGILNGVFLFYFPLNYGSEPFYSYTVAGTMLAVGKSLFSLRLVNVFFGTLTIAATYAWTKRFVQQRVALLTAVLLAVSFWPLAGSRQALRAGMLPFFMVGAVWFFWHFVQPHLQTAVRPPSIRWKAVFAFALCVAITLHIYLAARVAWTIFPLFILYLALFHRSAFRRTWLPTLVGLGLAGVLITPMLLYVERNPYVLTRLDMLNQPLENLAGGNLLPVLKDAGAALLAFVWPGFGDQFLAYNIPGRPVFDALTAVFFIIGILICLRRWRQPVFAFILIWFAVGIVPSLLTGPTANTTRNLAALPAVFMLPAVGFSGVWDWFSGRFAPRAITRPVALSLATLWLLFATTITVRDYFIRWGSDVAVRDAYQHTLVAAIDYLQEKPVVEPVVFSSVYPGPAHDPSIAQLLTASDPLPAQRWVDARYALMLPQNDDARAIIPAATAPHPVFAPLLTPLETISLRPDDLNPAFTSYTLNATASWWPADAAPVNFGDAVQLMHAEWLQNTVAPGATAELLTIWRVTDPTGVGPVVPPAFTTNAVLFTHVLRPDGTILTQRDALDAPSWSWQAGDVILQVHPLFVPTETTPDSYTAVVGIYDRSSQQRLPVRDQTSARMDTVTAVAPLVVTSEQ